MTDEPSSNGRYPDDEPDETDGLDDDAPLGEAEAEAASAIAGADTDETLDERVETVIEDLDAVERVREDESVCYLAAGRTFAVLMEDVLEVALDPAVAGAALKTPDTMPSSRGAGWIAFTPPDVDRFALDRAEAWVRAAHRLAVRG
jgi:hypothetical protein